MKDTINGASFYIGNHYDEENEFPDINFDGFTDLPITLYSYPLGDRSYDFLLFDETAKIFKKSQFNKLVNPTVHPDKKEIHTIKIDNCSGYRCGDNRIYKVISNDLVLVSRISSDLEWIDTAYFFISKYEELINDSLKVVKMDTTKIEY